ncbi:MAG: flagellar basal body-associated FliL family protein [Tagaea sp.]|nr:flagellar basal body-associated FliL family protein [Azospirillum sp.]MCA3267263.1 flagellar basal body-associated FliL family protein [Azospirillum sp.]MCZ8123214.1 flagellar basal body-associated FliL family protein [Magnetospirillum sp.]
MADDPPKEGAEGETPEGGEQPKKKFLSGKMLIIAGAGALVLLLGIGAGVYFLFFAGGPPPEQHAEDGPPKPAEPQGPVKSVYFNMPDLLVNLNAGAGRRTSFLKLTLSVELRSIDDANAFEANLPRIVDNFQVYLRELRPEDLRGSSGFLKLREELLTRVQLAAQPARVNDILFREMLVQ